MKTHRNLYRALLVAALFIGFSGCSMPINTSSGNKIDQTKLALVVKGSTTRQQIEQLFGPPMNVAMLPDGRRTMNYVSTTMQGQATMFGGQTSMRQESLQVILTKEGVVEDFEFSGSTQNSDMRNGFGGMKSESTVTK